jgi:uncharacterized membrane protein
MQSEILPNFSSHVNVLLYSLLFAVAHSGMAALRPKAEQFIPPRIYRVLFVIVSFAISIPWLGFIIIHRYDGLRLWNLQEYSWVHGLVMLISIIAFLFLYPGSFQLAEITTIRKPKQHFFTTGIIRVSRHPQLTGMTLWCISHTLWMGSTFMIATSIGLIGYHVLASWNGDRKRLELFGDEYKEFMKNTSIIPFKAILDGRQPWKPSEFLDKAYFWLILFIIFLYQIHPWIRSISER